MTGRPSSPAALHAIAHGLTGLDEMSELSGTPRRTLADWYKARPVLFDVVAMGCAQKKGKKK